MMKNRMKKVMVSRRGRFVWDFAEPADDGSDASDRLLEFEFELEPTRLLRFLAAIFVDRHKLQLQYLEDAYTKLS